MMKRHWRQAAMVVALFGVLALGGNYEGAIAGQAVAGDQPSLAVGSVTEAAGRLRPGQFLWAPQIAPKGPVLVVVSLSTQRAVVYRNGVPIGISTVSTGRKGYETPTGVFVILEKQTEHFSSTYDNAPMPYMQRLTWKGIALHAGNLPGYPASHGCIRLPHEFARHLYQNTQRGMTVVITDRPDVPRIAPAQEMLAHDDGVPANAAAMDWHPKTSPDGPVSIVISAADKRIVVLRNGMTIGSAAVDIDGGVRRTTAYILESSAEGERHWLRLGLPGQSSESESLRGRIKVADPFRTLVTSVLAVGTTVIVTNDSLRNSPAPALTVIEAERDPRQ